MNDPAWEETWEQFGKDKNNLSAFEQFPNDRDSANYCYGWYMYLRGQMIRDANWIKMAHDLQYSSDPEDHIRHQGYLDAKAHYEWGEDKDG